MLNGQDNKVSFVCKEDQDPVERAEVFCAEFDVQSTRDCVITLSKEILAQRYDKESLSLEHGIEEQREQDYRASLADRSSGFVTRPRDHLVITIYCDEYGNSWWGPWGPSSTGAGIGGSEEAVIYMSKELARIHNRKIWIEVYAKPPPHEIGVTNGVAWYPFEWYSTKDAPDVFVSWRYSISATLGRHATQTYLWLQDIGPSISKQLTE
eukprot:g4551.t1